MAAWYGPGQSLNEGGGLHPRDPSSSGSEGLGRVARSMKAGAFTPAILEELSGHVLAAVQRSMKAGAFTPAIPLAGRQHRGGIFVAQ